MSVTPIREPNKPQHRYDSSPGLLQESMQELERELDLMLNPWSEAEDAFVRTTADRERHAAIERLRLKRTSPPAKNGGPTIDDLDAMVLVFLWDDHEQLMADQLDAEAKIAAFKAKYKVAERALSSKQSRLNADVKLNPGHR